MAVSKRLRFEILRRDGNSCRYCGGVAPDVILTIDHVIPVALGGTDDPSNLVAACKDCNAGKSSVHSDAPLIADVADDAIRWSKAMQAAFERETAKLEKRDDYLDEFSDAWDGWRDGNGQPVDLPDDWRRSVAKWYGLGYPIDLLRDAITTTMPKSKVPNRDKFRYMAGVVWSTITELEQQTAAMLAAPAPPKQSVHVCNDRDCIYHGPDGVPCFTCDEVGCDWMCAAHRGHRVGVQHVRDEQGYPIDTFQHLSNVCDGAVISAFEAQFQAVSF